MREFSKLTAVNWKMLKELEARVGRAYERQEVCSPLNIAETLRLLHDVREYKTLRKELKGCQVVRGSTHVALL